MQSAAGTLHGLARRYGTIQYNAARLRKNKEQADKVLHKIKTIKESIENIATLSVVYHDNIKTVKAGLPDLVIIPGTELKTGTHGGFVHLARLYKENAMQAHLSKNWQEELTNSLSLYDRLFYENEMLRHALRTEIHHATQEGIPVSLDVYSNMIDEVVLEEYTYETTADAMNHLGDASMGYTLGDR